MTNSSPVQRMFDGRSIFVTGGSGFIGRVLIEKLLFTYRGIERVYILLRTKRKQKPTERLEKILNVPLFNRIRALENGQQLLDKLIIIPGDIGEPKLGISDEDMEKLVQDETLSIVFHSAATIKFDAPLKTAIKLNIEGTKMVIDLCKKLPNLCGLCHVSTAFVNSCILDNSPIEEKLYPVEASPWNLMKLAELMDEDTLQILKPHYVDKWPNTYTFTKAMAEHYIVQEASGLPVIIVRPSVVVAALKEPLHGWIDNINGPSGLMIACIKGAARTLHCGRSTVADLIPVDIVVNTMIASVHYVAKTTGKLETTINNQLQEKTKGSSELKLMKKLVDTDSLSEPKTSGKAIEKIKTNDTTTTINTTIVANGIISNYGKKNSQRDEESCNGNGENDTIREQQEKANCPPIIHCNSGDLNPLTWGFVEDNVFPTLGSYPSVQTLRYPGGSFKSNKYHDRITRFFVHYLPALILDLICSVIGKKPMFISLYEKLHSAMDALNHFMLISYNFKTKNISLVENALDKEDRKVLFMDIAQMDWLIYWKYYILGIRRYLLKEDDETIPQAIVLLNRAYYREIIFRIVLTSLLFSAGYALTRCLTG